MNDLRASRQPQCKRVAERLSASCAQQYDEAQTEPKVWATADGPNNLPSEMSCKVTAACTVEQILAALQKFVTSNNATATIAKISFEGTLFSSLSQ